MVGEGMVGVVAAVSLGDGARGAERAGQQEGGRGERAGGEHGEMIKDEGDGHALQPTPSRRPIRPPALILDTRANIVCPASPRTAQPIAGVASTPANGHSPEVPAPLSWAQVAVLVVGLPVPLVDDRRLNHTTNVRRRPSLRLHISRLFTPPHFPTLGPYCISHEGEGGVMAAGHPLSCPKILPPTYFDFWDECRLSSASQSQNPHLKR